MPRPMLNAEDVAATQLALLEHAEALYEGGGLEAMSFRALAHAYGCSSTMPYRYFASKAEIVDGLRIRAYEWLAQSLHSAIADHTDPRQALQTLAQTYVEAAVARPRLYELLYSAQGAMAEDEASLARAKRSALGVCQRVFEQLARRSTLTLRTDPNTAAHLFWAAAHGLVSLHAGGFLVLGRDIERLLPVLFDGLSQGMIAERVENAEPAEKTEGEASDE